MYPYKKSDKWILAAAGAVLAGLGVYLLFRGGIALPRRTPGKFIRFEGLSLFLLAAGPLAAGLTLLSVLRSRVSSGTAGMRAGVLLAIILVGLAFLFAER